MSIDYLEKLHDITNEGLRYNDVHLSVYGHSLDETDGDVIEELFNAANTITIYYHIKEKVPEFLRNLIRIFGKKKFDEMRLNKQLTFINIKDAVFDGLVSNANDRY